jgi:hypothetical protein
MVISNFQLGSDIARPSENPYVGGSIPSLAINGIIKLRPPMRWPFSFHLYIHLFFAKTLSSLYFQFVPTMQPSDFGGLNHRSALRRLLRSRLRRI